MGWTQRVVRHEYVVAYTNRLLAETPEEIGRADQKASVLLGAVGVAVMPRIGQLVVLSGIAQRKYRFTQVAMWLLAGSAVAMVAAVSFRGSGHRPLARSAEPVCSRIARATVSQSARSTP